MLEGKWDAVPPQLLTVDGSAQGLVTVADTAGFRVKMVATLKSTTPANSLVVQIKRVLSPTLLIVGANDNKIWQWKPIDVSAFTVASGAFISAEQQDKNNIPGDDHYRAIYESDPVVADRVVQVDKYGNFYDKNNPMPIIFDGTVAIGDVSIVDPDSGVHLKVNPDGSINVVIESIPSSNANVVSKYNEIVGVASNATVQLITYTVPINMQAVLQKCSFSGDNIGKYQLLINNVVQETGRTMFGADLTGMFDFTSGNDSGLLLNAGDVIKVQVFNPRPYSADFNARLQVLEIIL